MGEIPQKPQSLFDLISQVEEFKSSKPHSSPLSSSQKRARTIARLCLVQALYQMDIGGTGLETVISEFLSYRFDGDVDGEGQILANADRDYFEQGLRGVVDQQAKIDPIISEHLASDWRLERLDATVRAILRAGTWEIVYQHATPSEVAIDEYVDLARAFFNDGEAHFINAALDSLRKTHANI